MLGWCVYISIYSANILFPLASSFSQYFTMRWMTTTSRTLSRHYLSKDIKHGRSLAMLSSTNPNQMNFSEINAVYDSKVAATYSQVRATYSDEWTNIVIQASGGEAAMKQKSLLDIATGTGQVLQCVGPYFKKVMAIDLNANMVHQATQTMKNKLHNNQNNSNIQCYEGNAEDAAAILSSAGALATQERIDVITAAQCLHWLDLPKIWSNLQLLLAEDGVFIISTFGPEIVLSDAKLQPINDDDQAESSLCSLSSLSPTALVQGSEYMKELWKQVGMYVPKTDIFYSHFANEPLPFKQIERRSFAWRRWLTFADIAQFIRTHAGVRVYNENHPTSLFPVDDFVDGLARSLGYHEAGKEGVGKDDAAADKLPDLDQLLFAVEWKTTLVICKEFDENVLIKAIK